jgi:hypothetical protein
MSLRGRVADGLPPRRHRGSPDSGAASGPVSDNSVGGRSEPAVDERPALLATLNAEMNRRLDRQWDVVSELDTKSGLLVTLALAAAGLVLSGHHSAIGYVALVAFAVAVGFAMACLSVRPWQNAPAPDIVVELEHADSAVFYDRLIRAKAVAFASNQGELARKADWLKITTWWLAVPMLLTAVWSLT